MNFLKSLPGKIRQSQHKSLAIFAVCYLIILGIGVNGFGHQVRENQADETKIGFVKTRNHTSHLHHQAEVSYYRKKIEKYLAESKAEKGEEPVLTFSETGAKHQFVGGGTLVSKRVRALSQEEFDVFAKIIEAEAGTEPYETKLMIANVILNRVDSPYFPDTISEVVFQKSGRIHQFSPVGNGGYQRAEAKPGTVKAAEDALMGKDNSGGALYFMVRKWSDPNSLAWFDSLTKVAQMRDVEFFK